MACQGTTNRGKPCKLQAIANSDYCSLHQQSAIVISERCHAIARNGNRCKHKTLRGVYCHQHLDQLEHLRVKNSSLPGAKLGLFPTKQFNRGENITPYTGDIVINADPDFGDDYALQIKKQPPTFISARRTNTAVGRFANARKAGQGRNNAQLVYNSHTRQANVRATKKIDAGTEITVAYGAEYWRNRAA